MGKKNQRKKTNSGKDALIIGGTGGIGKETALLLAETGAHITITGGSSQERLDRTLEEAGWRCPKADGFLFRLNCVSDVQNLFSEYNSRFSRLPDILIYAYGPFKRLSIGETQPEDWLFFAENNIAMPGTAVSLILPAMFERKWGRILLFGGTNTDSIRGFTSTTAYSATKTALGTLVKSVAKTAVSLGIDNVTCNAVCPGLVDTEYLDSAGRAYNREKSPCKKRLLPKTVAQAALGLLENPSINGAILPIDGGLYFA